MSKVLGIIAEYNPLHNGHIYHIKKSKELVHPDYTVCVITGNFVQRGNVSIVDKWSKAKMALSAGADLVIELPTIYSISSAENFAEGCIKIFDSLKMDTVLSFGSESGDINTLNTFADILYTEPQAYQSLLNHELKNGTSYPKARENALLMYTNDIRKYANTLSSPNNILAIEYLKAIKSTKSKIFPITIKRHAVDYNSTEPVRKLC
jgi:predicted nucleotidyltransferase